MTDEQFIPGSTSELMNAIEREWKSLMEVVEKLQKADTLTTPDEGGWSPKDNLAHLTEWMNILMGYHMDKRPAHEVMRVEPEVVRGWDMETINPVLFERNRNRSTADVLNELRRVYAELTKK
ncbi:MAG: ClbS/DfsB family four-helix bundle protein, partial [Anaerolineales bacterium]|nr:ClbS/DfsB family four-helix bundle protein [Anaerolineales bacterium]